MKPLEQLAAATVAAQQATREARGAVKDVHRAAKELRGELDAIVAQQVADAVAELGTDAREQMMAKVDDVVTRLDRDLRARLGL